MWNVVWYSENREQQKDLWNFIVLQLKGESGVRKRGEEKLEKWRVKNLCLKKCVQSVIVVFLFVLVFILVIVVIHHFHVDHNAPCLPPPPPQKILLNHCPRFLLGRLYWSPGEIWNNGYANVFFGGGGVGVNKVLYGLCENGELWSFWTLWSLWSLLSTCSSWLSWSFWSSWLIIVVFPWSSFTVVGVKL